MRKIATLVTAAALSVLPIAAAFAGPPQDGCPRGYELWDIAEEPYQADNRTDEEGNGDGWVCARQMGNQNHDGNQIYLFSDNDLPSDGRDG